MAKRKAKPATPAGAISREMVRVVAVAPDAGVRRAIADAVAAAPARCVSSPDLSSARELLLREEYDVVVLSVDQQDGDGLEFVREMAGSGSPVRMIVVCAEADWAEALAAMRSGATDVVPMTAGAAELGERVRAAGEQAWRLREERRRVERLQRICRRLNTAQKDVAEQVDVLCNDLVNAYQELADQMSHASLANEFSSLIRSELDLESLLRATLEFVLSKTGPTNAAVFLPTGHDEFSLGAYVNCDMPKDTADMLLDHLAEILGPRFEDEPGVLHLREAGALEERIGDDAHWLSESGLIVFSCRHEGECLAVVALFRDRRTPYAPELIDRLGHMRDIFAEQLARVVRIHNRHRGKNSWGGFEVDRGDDVGGMAA